MTKLNRTFLVGGLAVFAVGVMGCDEDRVRGYQVPKEASVPVVASAGAPRRGAGVEWTVPPGWRRLPGERQMRVATFEAGGAEGRGVEISVSAFPNQGGGLLANVNRWRGQLNLEPLVEAQLVKHIVPLSGGESPKGFTVDMTGSGSGGEGEPGVRIVGAIIDGGGGVSWFVKAMGEPAVLEPHKAAIIGFARSFRFADAGHADPHAHHAHHDHHNHGPSEGGEPGWQMPGHWQPDQSPSSMISAAFDIKNTGGAARLTLTVLPGEAGGALANLNRWRGQVGLPAVESLDDQVARVIDTSGGPRATVFDLVAPGSAVTDGMGRIVVATIPHDGNTWFVKLTGDGPAVDLELSNFDQLVRVHCAYLERTAK